MMAVDRNRNRLVLYGNNFRVCIKIIVDKNNVRCVAGSGFNYRGRGCAVIYRRKGAK